MLLAALPLVFFGTAWATLALRRQARGQAPDWRGAFLAASIAWGIVVALGTELLSIGQILTRGWLVALWSTGILAGLLCMAWQWRQARGRPAPPARQPVRLPRLGLALLSGIALIAAAVALIALVSPPNNWDSMTYHLGRVVHWIQNRSVVFFPTHILRQNQQPPWSEYAVMHFMLLGGGDRLANLVQWFAMAGSVLGVSLIARELGADWRGQLLAAVFAVSLPMGVLQGASTQNDYVLAFWLVCFVFFLLPFVRRGPVSQAMLLAMSASLALALLTKATAYVYAFPFAAVFGWVQLRAVGGRAWLSAAVVMVVVVLLVNGGHYWRNISLFGLPLGF